MPGFNNIDLNEDISLEETIEQINNKYFSLNTNEERFQFLVDLQEYYVANELLNNKVSGAFADNLIALQKDFYKYHIENCSAEEAFESMQIVYKVYAKLDKGIYEDYKKALKEFPVSGEENVKRNNERKALYIARNGKFGSLKGGLGGFNYDIFESYRNNKNVNNAILNESPINNETKVRQFAGYAGQNSESTLQRLMEIFDCQPDEPIMEVFARNNHIAVDQNYNNIQAELRRLLVVERRKAIHDAEIDRTIQEAGYKDEEKNDFKSIVEKSVGEIKTGGIEEWVNNEGRAKVEAANESFSVDILPAFGNKYGINMSGATKVAANQNIPAKIETDYEILKNVFKGLEPLNTGDDNAYREIAEFTKTFSETGNKNFANKKEARDYLMNNNYQLRDMMGSYINSHRENKDDKYLAVVRGYGMLMGKIEKDEQTYGSKNPVNYYLNQLDKRIKSIGRLNIDQNNPEAVQNKNAQVEKELTRFFFLLELNRQYQYADSKKYKEDNPKESDEWKMEIRAILNSDQFDEIAGEFFQQSEFAKTLKSQLRDKKNRMNPETNQMIPIKDDENNIKFMYSNLTDNIGNIMGKVGLAISNNMSKNYPGDVHKKWQYAMKDLGIDTPPVHKDRTQLFNNYQYEFPIREAGKLDMNFELRMWGRKESVRKASKERNGNKDEEVIFMHDDFNENNKRSLLRVAEKNGNTFFMPLNGEIDKLEQAKRNVYFGSSEYDNILEELKAIDQAQKQLDLELLSGVDTFDKKQDTSDRALDIINRKKNLLYDIRHYIYRKHDEKNNSSSENTNSKKRRLAMTEVFKSLDDIITKSENEYRAFNNDKKPERYLGAVIHELERGNKENSKSKSYNTILEKMKQMNERLRSIDPDNKDALIEQINKEILLYNEMNEYVANHYGDVRDRKSEVYTKVNGKSELKKAGFVFDLNDFSGKKPLEPSDPKVKRYKLMLENMERFANIIIKQAKTVASQKSLDGFYKKLETHNKRYGIKIKTGLQQNDVKLGQDKNKNVIKERNSIHILENEDSIRTSVKNDLITTSVKKGSQKTAKKNLINK